MSKDKNQLFVERRDQGDYAVRKPGSERASAVCDTQAEAYPAGQGIEPQVHPHG